MLVKEKISRLFAEKVPNGQFDPVTAGFERLKGTQVFLKRIKSSRKKPLRGDLSAEELKDACEHIFDFLRIHADRHSPRDIYKSAGALIGRQEKGGVVILVSVNGVPRILETAGVNGEDRFDGWKRGESENATVHFEMHCQLAAGMVGDLTDVVMFNCDFMCPNCAKHTAAFGAKYCIVDGSYETRPLMTRIITSEGTDHRETTANILKKAGIGLLVHDRERGLLRIEKSLSNDFRTPVAEDYKRLSHEDIAQIRMRMIGRLYQDAQETESAAVLIFYKERRTYIFHATSNIFSDEQEYRGHHPGRYDPLSLLLVHASAQGFNVGKAEVYMRGKLDVNCALHAAVARPKWIYLADGQACLAPGAKRIFELSEQKIITPEEGAVPYLQSYAAFNYHL